MSDALILGLATLIVGLISSIIAAISALISAYIAYLMAKLNAGQKEAAKELAAADATNAARANETLDVVKTVHVLVNHENHVLLAAVADLSRYKADHSGLPEDRVAADKAATALAQHDARQAMADRAKIEMGTDEQKKGR